MPAYQPFSTTMLDAAVTRATSAIPAGKTGQIAASVTTDGGARIEGAARWKSITGGGWAERQWGGRGWSAGAKASVAF